MIFHVYFLYAPDFNKTYVGYTSNLEERFKSHNELGHKGWTIKYRPWPLVYTEKFDSKSKAMDRERYFKTGRGRKQLKEILNQWISENL